MTDYSRHKMCCIVNPNYRPDPDCDCGIMLCADCKLAILLGIKNTRDKRRKSKYWPKTSLNLLADYHYQYNKNCSVVQIYIKSYGEPLLEAQTSL